MRFVGGASRNGRSIDLDRFRIQMEEICRKHRLVLAYLHGSYAQGNPGPLSDIDVAVMGRRKLGWQELGDISADLSDLLEDDAIDLVDLRTIPDHLAHRILKEGVCLFARNLPTRIDYEVAVEMRYADFEPLRREYLAAVERRIESGTFGR